MSFLSCLLKTLIQQKLMNILKFTGRIIPCMRIETTRDERISVVFSPYRYLSLLFHPALCLYLSSLYFYLVLAQPFFQPKLPSDSP